MDVLRVAAQSPSQRRTASPPPQVALGTYLARWSPADLPKPTDRNPGKVRDWIDAVFVKKRFYAEPQFASERAAPEAGGGERGHLAAPAAMPRCEWVVGGGRLGGRLLPFPHSRPRLPLRVPVPPPHPAPRHPPVPASSAWVRATRPRPRPRPRPRGTRSLTSPIPLPRLLPPGATAGGRRLTLPSQPCWWCLLRLRRPHRRLRAGPRLTPRRRAPR